MYIGRFEIKTASVRIYIGRSEIKQLLYGCTSGVLKSKRPLYGCASGILKSALHSLGKPCLVLGKELNSVIKAFGFLAVQDDYTKLNPSSHKLLPIQNLENKWDNRNLKVR